VRRRHGPRAYFLPIPTHVLEFIDRRDERPGALRDAKEILRFFRNAQRAQAFPSPQPSPRRRGEGSAAIARFYIPQMVWRAAITACPRSPFTGKGTGGGRSYIAVVGALLAVIPAFGFSLLSEATQSPEV